MPSTEIFRKENNKLNPMPDCLREAGIKERSQHQYPMLKAWDESPTTTSPTGNPTSIVEE